MSRLPISFHQKLQEGKVPVTYVVINTHLGNHVISEKKLNCTVATAIDYQARISGYSSFERTSVPVKDDILSSYNGKQLQHLSIYVINTDRYYSRILPNEPFLGRRLSVKVGFEEDGEANHISIFTGTISEIDVMQTMTIEAEER